MTIRLVLISLVASACLLLACSDDDTPTAPVEEPQGHWETTTILSSEYQNNRFFRLDLPTYQGHHQVLGYDRPDQPGRDTVNELIDLASVQVFRAVGPEPPRPEDITYAAATTDSTGRWGDAFLDGVHEDAWRTAWVWRPVEFTLLLDVDGEFIAVDLGQPLEQSDLVAVVYRVVDHSGQLRYTVGDHPGYGDQPGLEIEGQPYYRFKLLKPTQQDPFTFQYVLRNIYALGSRYFDPGCFELTIQTRAAGVTDPDRHGTRGLTYLRLFGLDVEDESGEPGPDGMVDVHRQGLFDLDQGLLRFPLDFPFPFAADEETYRAYAQPGPGQWEWEGTTLQASVEAEVGFYQWDTPPQDYFRWATFEIVVRHWVFDDPGEGLVPPPAWLSLAHPDWVPASLPQAPGVSPENRAEDIRWYAPRQRVVRRLLEPDLEGPARDDTEPALNLTVDPLGEPWQWTWAGIMTPFPRPGLDPAGLDRLEIWINDFSQAPMARRGILHVDLGFMDEDFHWPVGQDGELEVRTWQFEDLNHDGIFVMAEEDVGLDAELDPATNEVIREGPAYAADPGTEADPYPHLNNTARNGREDSEDLNGDTRLSTDNRYLSWAVDLARDPAEVDVARDHPDADLEGTAWRQYVLPLADGAQVADKYESAFLDRFMTLRIWIENPDLEASGRYQIARLRFR